MRPRERLLLQENNACAVCRKPFDAMKQQNVHVDHCHETGKVRGILCLYCNRGIGCFFNEAEVLRGAARYLEASHDDFAIA